MQPPAQKQLGMTLVELLVVMSLFVVVFAFSSVSLSGLIPKTNTQEYTETLISDFKRQQMQAIQGRVSSGGSSSPYGIYLNGAEYILFEGSSYNSAESTNIVTSLPLDMQFINVTLPAQQIVFQPVSGEIQDYDQNNDTFTLQNTNNGLEVQFEINQLGVLSVIE